MLKRLGHILLTIAKPAALMGLATLTLLSCSSNDHSDARKIDVVDLPIYAQTRNDNHTTANQEDSASEKIFNKCTAQSCYEFKTPHGVYRLNNPRTSDFVKFDISRLLDRAPVSRDFIDEQLEIQQLDMRRAHCLRPADAFCGNTSRKIKVNYQVLSDAFEACRDNLNFGQIELSECVKKQLPRSKSKPKFHPETGERLHEPQPTLMEITQCYMSDNETRKPLNYWYFKGSLDEAIEATFDTRCLAWHD